MCRAVPGDIDAVLEVVAAAGRRPSDVSVLILSTASDLHLKYKLGRALLAREGRDPPNGSICRSRSIARRTFA